MPTKKAAPRRAAGSEAESHWLEDDLAVELNDASILSRRGERSIRSGRGRNRGKRTPKQTWNCHVVIRIAKVRVVENVVEDGGEGESHTLGELEVLPHRQVRVEVAGTAELVTQRTAKPRFGARGQQRAQGEAWHNGATRNHRCAAGLRQGSGAVGVSKDGRPTEIVAR